MDVPVNKLQNVDSLPMSEFYLGANNTGTRNFRFAQNAAIFDPLGFPNVADHDQLSGSE